MTSTWTDGDFDKLGWHDVHIHGFRILDGEYGRGQLWLDIDYILEWIPLKKSFRFRVAPALLKFRDIMWLRFSLDYATPTAGMCPFSIDGIEREPIAHGDFRWTMAVIWPAGEITFESPGFTQTLTGPVVETASQHLTDAERNGDSWIA